MSAVLQVRSLRKNFGNFRALRGIDLDVQEGEIFGFLGSNGAGKTTFTKCVTGFLRPTSGSIKVAGIDAVSRRSKAMIHVGIVPDEYELYEHLTGTQNLQYFASLYGLKEPVRSRRIAQVLEIVGMTEKAGKKAKAFSHGMKQRICIAQALLHKPKIIILDEPTNGLDPRGAVELRGIMRRLAAAGTAVFLNSHVMSEVEQVCDRIAIVREGKLVALGTPKQLKQRVHGEGRTTIALTSLTAALLQAAKGAGAVEKVGSARLQVQSNGKVPAVVTALVRAGAEVVSVIPEESGLEEAFLAMTEVSQ